VLITSGDCRTRVVEATQVVQKFIGDDDDDALYTVIEKVLCLNQQTVLLLLIKMLVKAGFRNASSQISASFSPNGKYIICASEDSQVYVWKHEEMHYSGKGRNVIANQAHEHFPCKDVSVAIPWPCNVKGDLPPSIAAQNQKKNSTPPAPAPAAANNKKNLPPLPKKSNNNQATENSPGSPEKDHAALSRTESGVGDSKRNAPPKKSNNHAMEGDSIEEELEAITRSENGSGDSLSASPSGRHGGDPASISAAATPSGSSWSSNYSSGDGSNGDWSTNPSAWGMVIVTAGFGGEIRCYQNFGLPRRMRQNTLFMGPTL